MRILSFLATVLLLAAATPAAAQNCAGFTDVPANSTFCQNIEWIKNRGVTTGCSGGVLYCPTLNTSREQMAAFINRLGNIVTPTQLRVDAAPGAIDLDASAVVCQTTDYAVLKYPRRAFVDLAFTATAGNDVDLAADLVISSNGGSSWAPLTAIGSKAFVAGGHWGSVSNLADADLDVGQNVRFGVAVNRGGAAGSTDLADSRCQLRVSIVSRTGASSPF